MPDPTIDKKKPKYKFAVLSGEKATGIAVLDYYAYGRWPHWFTVLATKHKVPPDFIVTLLYLWDATVGRSEACEGDLAVSQVPVRARNVRKYLAAICRAGLFEVLESKSGDKTGDFFVYNDAATPETWETFFRVIGTASRFGGWDKVSPETFGGFIGRAVTGEKLPANPVLDARGGSAGRTG